MFKGFCCQFQGGYPTFWYTKKRWLKNKNGSRAFTLFSPPKKKTSRIAGVESDASLIFPSTCSTFPIVSPKGFASWHPFPIHFGTPPPFGMFPETSISPTKTWKIRGLKIMRLVNQPTRKEALWNPYQPLVPLNKTGYDTLIYEGVRYGGRGFGWLATRKRIDFFGGGWILAMGPCKQQKHFPHTELQGGNTFPSDTCGEITPIGRVITPATV